MIEIVILMIMIMIILMIILYISNSNSNNNNNNNNNINGDNHISKRINEYLYPLPCTHKIPTTYIQMQILSSSSRCGREGLLDFACNVVHAASGV